MVIKFRLVDNSHAETFYATAPRDRTSPCHCHVEGNSALWRERGAEVEINEETGYGDTVVSKGENLVAVLLLTLVCLQDYKAEGGFVVVDWLVGFVYLVGFFFLFCFVLVVLFLFFSILFCFVLVVCFVCLINSNCWGSPFDTSMH